METIDNVVSRLNDLSKGDKPFSITKGRKYTKIVQRMGGVHCFIDVQGNIFKPASWASPAKGVRATLETIDLDKIDQFGSWLYRYR